MLFEDYWNKTCEKNTSFKTKEQVTIKVTSIKRLMEQAYDTGIDFDIYSGRYDNDFKDRDKQKDDDVVNSLKNIFGMNNNIRKQ